MSRQFPPSFKCKLQLETMNFGTQQAIAVRVNPDLPHDSPDRRAQAVLINFCDKPYIVALKLRTLADWLDRTDRRMRPVDPLAPWW